MEDSPLGFWWFVELISRIIIVLCCLIVYGQYITVKTGNIFILRIFSIFLMLWALKPMLTFLPLVFASIYAEHKRNQRRKLNKKNTKH